MKKSLKDFTPMKLEEQQKTQGGAEMDCNCGPGGKHTIRVFCAEDLSNCVNQCIAYCA